MINYVKIAPRPVRHLPVLCRLGRRLTMQEFQGLVDRLLHKFFAQLFVELLVDHFDQFGCTFGISLLLGAVCSVPLVLCPDGGLVGFGHGFQISLAVLLIDREANNLRPGFCKFFLKLLNRLDILILRVLMKI